MKYESTISLRILKSTWGISIDLTASISNNNSNTGKYFISDKIKFNICDFGIKLSKTDIEMLINGLKWVSNDIESKLETDQSIVIELVNAVFAETDFQTEGFYYAISTWASDYFRFSLPEYEVTFDKNENKYKFPDIELREQNKNWL